MVFSIDKLDGAIVSLAADRVEVKEVCGEDYLVTFYSANSNMNARDNKGHIYADFSDKIVGAFYLSNIVGFREVTGLSDEDLAEMFRANAYIDEDEVEEDEGNSKVIT